MKLLFAFVANGFMGRSSLPRRTMPVKIPPPPNTLKAPLLYETYSGDDDKLDAATQPQQHEDPYPPDEQEAMFYTHHQHHQPQHQTQVPVASSESYRESQEAASHQIAYNNNNPSQPLARANTNTEEWDKAAASSSGELARTDAKPLARAERQPFIIGDDRVEIDVGGKVFLTSKGTLMSHSTFFLARFLPNGSQGTATPWDTMTPQGDAPERIFLDQDPEAFGILLSYMRIGYLEATALTSKVLALADILGMETLLSAVKCISFRYLNPSQVNARDEDVCLRFDQAYGGIMPAMTRGILPETIRPIPPEKAPKQIAQLLVYDGWVSNFQKTDLSLFVEVKVTANVLSEEGLYHPRAEGYDTVVVPDCHTIHDAINWLYQRGFEFTEDEYQTIHFPNDHRAWENIWFTRPLAPNQADRPSNVIRFDPALYPQVERKRQRVASLLISHDQMDAFLYADKGRKTRMGFPPESNSGLPEHVPSGLRNQGFDSKISIESSRNAWAMVSWLYENGYTEMQNNTKLRKLLLEIQYRAFSHQENRADPDERQQVDQDEVDFRLLSCEVPPDSKLFETWPTGPFE